jgi:hypothetical protein
MLQDRRGVKVSCNCYASVNIKALETLGYPEHICNYFVISDSWLSGKISHAGGFGVIRPLTCLV